MANDEKKIPEIPKKKSKGTVARMPEPEVVEVDGGPTKVRKPRTPKSGTLYTLLKNYDSASGTKMPLQSRQILTILDEADGKALEKGELLTKMKEVIVTRQPIERILAFYQPRLISGSYFKMTPIIAEVADAKPETASA